jgi:hypothetical protein
LCKLLGGKKIFIKKRPGEPDCTFADISKIKRKLSNGNLKLKLKKVLKNSFK